MVTKPSIRASDRIIRRIVRKRKERLRNEFKTYTVCSEVSTALLQLLPQCYKVVVVRMCMVNANLND